MASLYSVKDIPEDGKSRYLFKIELCGLPSCPYQLPADSWSNDPTKWPQLEWPEVYEYLINTPGVYTREAMRNRKSLEGHNQFTSGWVRTVLHFDVPKKGLVVLKADVMPSQRLNDAAHVPWVAIDKSTAKVVVAHCSCMAGMGESCSHIGALLFKVEAAIRMGYTKVACTDEACKWNNDFVKKVKGVPIKDVKLYSTKAVSGLKRKGPTLTYADQPVQTDEDRDQILKRFSLLKSKPVVLHSFSEHCESFIPTYVPPARAKLPNTLRSLYKTSNIHGNLQELSQETFDTMAMSLETIQYIYNITKKQSKSQVWHDMRCGRVTASVVHDVLHTDMENPSPSVIRNICTSSKLNSANIPALKWGLDNEKIALSEFEAYSTAEHTDFKIEDSGLLISDKYPFLGASADGIFNCNCHGIKAVIEIKCPYSLRDTPSFEDAISTNDGIFIDKNKSLKRSHRYFAQIQTQMFLHGVELCKFIIWTPNWTLNIDISHDHEFTEIMLSTVKEFYLKHIIPELLTRNLEQCHQGTIGKVASTSTSPLYCFCNKVYTDSETWIKCDATTCLRKWFHLACVNRKRIPKGKWYCKVCKKANKSNKSGAQNS